MNEWRNVSIENSEEEGMCCCVDSHNDDVMSREKDTHSNGRCTAGRIWRTYIHTVTIVVWILPEPSIALIHFYVQRVSSVRTRVS